MTPSSAAAKIIAVLSNRDSAVEPMRFPTDRDLAARPGMYAWWGDAVAQQTLGEEIGAALPPLLYAGQAGATRWPSGKRSGATLASRIAGQHIRGNARSSTFRLTISGVLLKHLGLMPPDRGKLDGRSNNLVSAWIAEHLRVALAPYDDRDTLGAVEAEVLAELDPPLNLGRCLPSEGRMRIASLRRPFSRRLVNRS